MRDWLSLMLDTFLLVFGGFYMGFLTMAASIQPGAVGAFDIIALAVYILFIIVFAVFEYFKLVK